MQQNTIRLRMVLLFCLAAMTPASCKGQAKNITIKGKIVKETSKNIWVIFQDKADNYWFGSDGEGLYRYDGKTITHLSTADELCNDSIREIQEDKDGNIYFTTMNGVSKYDGQAFTTLKVAADNDPTAWKLQSGDLWFKTNKGGPLRYDGKSLYQLKFPKNQMEDDYYKRFPNTPINPYDIYYMYKDSKGTMWFGTGALGICRYDGQFHTWLYEDHLTNVPNGGSFGIRSILEDRNGKYWFCNTKYRYSIQPGPSKEKDNGFVNYTREKGIDGINEPVLGGDRLYYQTIAEDSKGHLWMQTYRAGIWRYDGKQLTNYPVKAGTEDVSIVSMYQDRHGGLWLATKDYGVYKFNGSAFEKLK